MDSIPGYAFHPTADRFPLMQGDELAAFTADLKQFGLRDEIVYRVLSSGKREYLDGRNRLTICLQEGIHVRELREDVKDEDVDEWIKSRNLQGRRHLTSSQRAAVGFQLFKDKHGDDHDRSDGWAEKVAGEVGSNHQYVYVLDKAYSKPDTAHLIREVIDGRLNVKDVAKHMREKRQAEAVAAGESEGESAPARVEALDGMGNPVPDKFSGAFAARAEYQIAVDAIRELRFKLKKILESEGAVWSDATEVNALAATLENAVDGTAPYAICPKCDGDGRVEGDGRLETCDVCDRNGFVTRPRFDAFTGR